MIAATERCAKAKKSITVSREALVDLRRKLEEREKAVEDAIVRHETGEGQRGTIEKIEKEIAQLQADIAAHEKTMSALETALPGLHHDAQVEEASTNGVREYRGALKAYSETLSSCPRIETLTALIGRIQDYTEELRAAQDDFLSRGKALNVLMAAEMLSELGDVTAATLQAERESADRIGVKNFGDQLLLASEKFRELSSNIFHIIAVEYSDLQYRIEMPPEPVVEEICTCGKHRRVYDPATQLWKVFAKPGSIGAHPEAREEQRFAEYRGRENRPTFPCELND